jgi:hypothetical protein
MLLFDTDHIGIIQQQTRPEYDRIMQRMSGHSLTDFFVSIVSFQEQMLGWNAYLKRARTEAGIVRAYGMFQQVLADFAAFQVLRFDTSAARTYRLGHFEARLADRQVDRVREFRRQIEHLADARAIKMSHAIGETRTLRAACVSPSVWLNSSVCPSR